MLNWFPFPCAVRVVTGLSEATHFGRDCYFSRWFQDFNYLTGKQPTDLLFTPHGKLSPHPNIKQTCDCTTSPPKSLVQTAPLTALSHIRRSFTIFGDLPGGIRQPWVLSRVWPLHFGGEIWQSFDPFCIITHQLKCCSTLD